MARKTLLLLTALYLYAAAAAGASNLLPEAKSPKPDAVQKQKPVAAAKQAKAKGKAKPKQKDSAIDLTGNWYYEIDNNQHRGYIRFNQSGSMLSGIWHTTSKQEEDTPVVGQITGDTLVMRRSKVWGSHDQDFTLSILNKDQISGFGEGFFLHHTDLRMARVKDSH